MKKDSQKNAIKKRVTWTFEPDQDVLTAVQEFLKDNPERGAMTKLVNDAMRQKMPEAIAQHLDEQIAILEAKKKSLQGKGEGKR